jgi:hypothetical protein
MERYREIKGYDGIYHISNTGKIKSLKFGKEKTLKNCVDSGGYYYAGLSKNNKRKFFRVHRLVGYAFLENVNNYPEINHIDKDKSNNNAHNLEWCTRQQNADHGYSKKVLQYDMDGTFIKEWKSTCEVGRNGFVQQHISACCLGKLKHHKKYKWSYQTN